MEKIFMKKIFSQLVLEITYFAQKIFLAMLAAGHEVKGQIEVEVKMKLVQDPKDVYRWYPFYYIEENVEKDTPFPIAGSRNKIFTTEESIFEMRRKHTVEKISVRELALLYKCSESSIRKYLKSV